jgi:protein-glutamine gamma-glutamyltransferase
VIEPTPGYEVLGPKLQWSERVLAALVAVGWWLWEHALAAGLCLVGLASTWWKRVALLDALAVAVFRLFPGQSWRRCVRRVLWLLERRGRWAGRPRRTSQTLSAWMRSVLAVRPDKEDEIRQLMRMAEWCAYAPALAPPWSVPEVRSVCRRVLDEWTLNRWRTVVTAGVVRGEAL